MRQGDLLEAYDVDDRDLARLLSLGRIVLGGAMALMPRLSVRWWLAEPATPGLRRAARGLGARDVAIGIGTLVALENDGDVSRWLEAQAMADAADTVAAVAVLGSTSGLRRWISVLVPAAAAIVGLSLASNFDER